MNENTYERVSVRTRVEKEARSVERRQEKKVVVRETVVLASVGE